MALNICLLALVALASAQDVSPWGTHLSYGNDPASEMTISWVTRDEAEGSVVQYDTVVKYGLRDYQKGTQSQFVASSNNTQYYHQATLTGLQPGTLYYYQVGDGGLNWSEIFTFKTQPLPGSAYTPVLAIFGDMGINENAHKTLPRLADDVASGRIDAVLHIGDFAYDLDDYGGTQGDLFVEAIGQGISNYVPYHTTPGNHENNNDFFQYRARFNQMPGAETGASAFHSFNIGPVHVVMISSEAYFYFTPHGVHMVPEQYAWLEADLAAVNRSVTPWIITMAHRPMYCSPNDDSDDCHNLYSLFRDGLLGKYAMEPLLHKYGVEMHFAAHEHSYERNYPVFNFQWDNSTTGPSAYVDFDRPIHILTGAAGCPENQDPWQVQANPFSALRLNVYGYGRLHAVNGTHLYWEFLTDSDGRVVDSMWIVKHSHGPYPPLPATAHQQPRPAPFTSIEQLSALYPKQQERERKQAAAAAAGVKRHWHAGMDPHLSDWQTTPVIPAEVQALLASF